MKQTRQSGLTLVELLVVLACLALLAALLLPAITVAKLKAQRVQCAGNLHQLGVGLQVIVANDHGYPLLFGGTKGDGSWIGQLAVEGLGMTQPMSNYIRTGVWRCPRKTITGTEKELPASYGYNACGVVLRQEAAAYTGLCLSRDTRTLVTDAQVAQPGDMMAIGETFDAKIELARNPLYGAARISYQRHQGLDNVVFCDGHVEPIKLKYLFTDTTDEALSRWNRDHQPQRELVGQ